VERLAEQLVGPPLNAISIVRSAEDSGNQALSDDTWLASIPRGPVMRLGNEHVMGVYLQMFAEVAQGKSTPAEAVSAFAQKAQGIYRKWHNQKLV
jgi:hypothetical protein